MLLPIGIFLSGMVSSLISIYFARSLQRDTEKENWLRDKQHEVFADTLSIVTKLSIHLLKASVSDEEPDFELMLSGYIAVKTATIYVSSENRRKSLDKLVQDVKELGKQAENNQKIFNQLYFKYVEIQTFLLETWRDEIEVKTPKWRRWLH